MLKNIYIFKCIFKNVFFSIYIQLLGAKYYYKTKDFKVLMKGLCEIVGVLSSFC